MCSVLGVKALLERQKQTGTIELAFNLRSERITKVYMRLYAFCIPDTMFYQIYSTVALLNLFISIELQPPFCSIL